MVNHLMNILDQKDHSRKERSMLIRIVRKDLKGEVEFELDH
jgi:hypothetical protein